METTERHISLARFWRKFLRLTRGRVSVLRSLRVIAEEESDCSFKTVIEAIYNKVSEGATLSEAITDHPSEFSPAVRELIRSAEHSGAWDEILVEVADGLHEGTFC